MPEKETARRLLALVEERGLLKAALRSSVCSSCPTGPMGEPGLWELAGFVAAQRLRTVAAEKPRLVVSSPLPGSLLLASAVARELRVTLAPSTLGLRPAQGAYVEPVECNGLLTAISVPRSLVQRGPTVLVSASPALSCEHQVLRALSALLIRHGAHIVVLLALCPVDIDGLNGMPVVTLCDNI